MILNCLKMNESSCECVKKSLKISIFGLLHYITNYYYNNNIAIIVKSEQKKIHKYIYVQIQNCTLINFDGCVHENILS